MLKQCSVNGTRTLPAILPHPVAFYIMRSSAEIILQRNVKGNLRHSSYTKKSNAADSKFVVPL